MRDQAIRESVSEVGSEGGNLSGEGEHAAAEPGDAEGLVEGTVGAAEGEVFDNKRSERDSVFVEGGDEASVAVGVVEWGALEGVAIGGFDEV